MMSLDLDVAKDAFNQGLSDERYGYCSDPGDFMGALKSLYINGHKIGQQNAVDELGRYTRPPHQSR